MATRKILKTTLTVTILHPADEDLPSSLVAIAEEMELGNALGQITGRISQDVAPSDVASEERALAGDGTFFAALDSQAADDQITLTQLHDLIQAFSSGKDGMACTVDGSEMEPDEILFADEDEGEQVTSFILPPQHDLGRQIEIVRIASQDELEVEAECSDGIPYTFTFLVKGKVLPISSALDQI